MFKRQIAIGDIHGCFSLAHELVEEIIKFNPKEDRLIFMGDYIDRGTENLETVNYVSALKTEHPENIVLLAGNHEDLAYKALSQRTMEQMQLWFINGGIETVKSFGTLENLEKLLLPFIETLMFFFETPQFIYVHGGIPHNQTVYTAQPNALLWERNYKTYRGKNLIVGHTPHREVTKYENTIVVDTGAVFYGKLSGYDTVNDVIYEAVSDTIMQTDIV
ncbi:MAG: serine/threonine protein phosphatase [Candidatus Magnetoovum sp. WYHC-5]|nr:serine/threonine protein phosphatase [Candidatus Magnetoovum sp. WYHC-5]